MAPNNAALLADNSVYADVVFESPTLIIPRTHLCYQCMDFEAVPAPLRTSLLSQRVRQLSPFENSATWDEKEGNLIQLWFWDSDRVKQVLQDQNLLALNSVPETMFYPALENGFRLQPCIEGWELQYWVAKVLRQSRWFSIKPSVREQDDFIRASGVTGQPDWILGDTRLLSKPWNERPFWSKENLQRESVATRLLLGVFLVWFCLQLGLGIGTQIKAALLSTSVAARNAELADLVEQRDGAMRQQEFNHAVSILINRPSQLSLVASVRSCLSEFEFVMLSWQYQKGQITLLLQQDNLDTRALIEACNNSTVFSDVRAEPGVMPNQTRMLFSIKDDVAGEPAE